ncbi:hypothetical protein K5I29_07475 [Flavobacterium agricola]|uniref:Lipocalin-like domain-containing protein n=1 Tax=Flavobacterium agricola TaxID=2870839 RepID=A0ABY6LVQ5_9FLAO|nr:hypothetical protein [Flavobacterium agricola]UYW00408.1 hypothetical protein K5I29_07475 [Flavobacterium agricola]
MKNLAILALLLVITSSCTKDKLIGEWKFNKVVETDATKTASYFEKDFFTSEAIFAGNGYFLMLDKGTANPFEMASAAYQPKDQMLYGTWQRTEETNKIKLLLLNAKQNPILFIEEIKNDGDKVQFKSLINSNLNSLQFIFTKQNDTDLATKQYNFLAPDINTWRIPANQSEGYKQINNRVKQSLEFALLYYKYCQKNSDHLSLNFLKPIPIRFASNGIATRKNENWDALFYDADQAAMSYKILKDAFKASKKIPNNIKTPFEIGIYTLEQLIYNLEE